MDNVQIYESDSSTNGSNYMSHSISGKHIDKLHWRLCYTQADTQPCGTYEQRLSSDQTNELLLLSKACNQQQPDSNQITCNSRCGY